jgi:glutaredoxin
MNRRFESFERITVVLAAIALALFGASCISLIEPPLAARAGELPSATPSSISVASNQSVASLAAYLRKIGARMYGAYWCPHCTEQKELFGSAFRSIDYVECDPGGANARPALCKKANISGYPTWEINGKFYPGTQSLEELANLSGYSGPKNF